MKSDVSKVNVCADVMVHVYALMLLRHVKTDYNRLMSIKEERMC